MVENNPKALQASPSTSLLLTGRALRTLREIYFNPGCKRRHICASLNLQPSVLSPIMQALDQVGILETGRAPIEGRGRPSHIHRVAGDIYTTVGLELSSQRIGGLVLRANGDVMAQVFEESDRPPSPNTSIKRLANILKKLIKTTEQEANAIGVAISGVVAPDGKTSREFPSVEGWENVDVAGRLARAAKIDAPVGLINNVRAATLAELRTGEAKKFKNFLYIHAGQGLGIGVVIDGNVYHGASNMAGEFGHVSVKEDGPLCYCGSRGCLESYASPTAVEAQCIDAIEKKVRTSIPRAEDGSVRFMDILEAAEQGDRLASNLIETATEHLATAAANTVNVLNPEALVLGGVFANGSERWLTFFRRSFQSHLVPFMRGTVEIHRASHDEEACSLGAAIMMMDRQFTELPVLRDLLVQMIEKKKQARKASSKSRKKRR